jgi:alanine racemase
MVRSGQVPYGWLDYVQDSVKLYPTLSFLTRISYLKRVKMGQRIGYGLTWAAPEDTWVGTLPVGYGDGLNRRFSNRGHVLVNGKSYPIVGMMAMDQSMINLGPNAQAKVGDEVVLMGRSGDLEITLQEFATALDTVPWEITSLISPRVDRVYMDSSGQSQKYLWEPLPRVLASV